MMRLHLDNRQHASDRAHLLLLVTLDNVRWIADVALGSMSMCSPVRVDGAVGDQQLTPDGPRRVSRKSGPHDRWLLLEARRVPTGGEWREVYEFDPDTEFDERLMRCEGVASQNFHRFLLSSSAENAHASSAESDLATRLIVTRCMDASRNRVTLRNLVSVFFLVFWFLC